MKITEKDVLYVADLAHLELTDDERQRMLKDLNSILDYIDRLNQLDTSDVEPMAQVSVVSGGSARVEHAMRDDAQRTSLDREAALRNAPDADGVFFKVPKVIER